MTIANVLEPITATIVSNKERHNFLFEKMGNNAPVFEQLLFNYMDNICEKYNGGFWEFEQLSNGGFFMFPRVFMMDVDSTELEINVASNGYEGVMSNVTAGIVVTLLSLSYFSFQVTDEESKEVISDLFHQLRDYALDHDDVSKIFAAID